MNWALAKELLTCALLLGGLSLMLLAAIGMLKFPDVFCRGHAQTTAMTLGISSMLLALWLHLGTTQAGAAVVFGIAAQVLTIPVAGHMISLLSFQKRVPRHRQHHLSYHKGYSGQRLEP
jgi:multicomponent Na+:H+ antiporter subunit G